MEKIDLLNILYDYYGILLSDQERNIFEAYYFDNMTMQEISEELEVSKNAIHKHLKKIEEVLINYEDKLKLMHKHQKIVSVLKDRELIDRIEDYI